MQKQAFCERRISNLLWPRLAKGATVLDPTNPSNFKQDGTQTATPGTVLTLQDASNGDIILLFAPDPDAAAGIDLDVVATFQMINPSPENADAGNRLVINDGVTRAAIASCIFQKNIPGMGLYSSGPTKDQASYPVFVPVDWVAAPCAIRLRRWANGDAELIEINGTPPTPRALLTADKAAGPTPAFFTVEFGCASPEAMTTVEYSAFRSERVVQAVAGTLSFTSFRLHAPGR
jgi:hypothetical protein